MTIQPALWAPNGPVSALTVANNTIYLGGLFTQVGPVTGSFVAIDEVTGNADHSFPKIDGTVRAIAPDGHGGWYISGVFSAVDAVPRKNIAHIHADKRLDMDWNPGADRPGTADPNGAAVNTIGVYGSTVYIGGGFSHAGGQPRNYLAAIDATSGNIMAWNPNPDLDVSALLIRGNTVYVSGIFSTIAGESRRGLAAIDATTGDVTGWNPGVSGVVKQLAVSDIAIYVGGFFTIIGGQSRKNIAALDPITGAATAWTPEVNGGVNALLVSDATVYIGGAFTMVGGQSRDHLAALDSASGMVTAWNPGVSGSPIAYLDPTVATLTLHDNSIFVGGNFTTLGSQPRNNLGAVDQATGAATAWDPLAGGEVAALAVNNGMVYAGGNFTVVGGVRRANLAAIDSTTGMATLWNPGASGPSDGRNLINVLKVQDATVYAGGAFTTIGGQNRTSLAALTTTTGAATAWNPAPNGTVMTLEISGTTIYVGGDFSTIGDQNRAYLAAIDTTTGRANDWNPAPNAFITALALHEHTIYVAGNFTDVTESSSNNYVRDHLAAIDTITGSVTPWRPNNLTVYPPVSGIYALLVRGSTIYIGAEHGVYAVNDAEGDRLIAWNPPELGGSVVALAASDTTLFVGGGNISFSGSERRYLVALDPMTGAISMPLPEPDFTVDMLALLGSTLYVGGGFFSLSGNLPAFFAGLALGESAPTAISTDASTIERTSARLNGIVTANGNSTTVMFHLTTISGDYTGARVVAATPHTISGFVPTAVATGVTELTPATTYYYRVVATSSAGTIISNEQSFTTLSEAVPTAIIKDARNIRNTSAILNGIVNANGSPTTVMFQLTTMASDYTDARAVAATPNIVSGVDSTPVVATVTELTSATTYYYRVVATSSAGTTTSDERSFTTLSESTLFLPLLLQS